jgi:hypothetical protein
VCFCSESNEPNRQPISPQPTINIFAINPSKIAKSTCKHSRHNLVKLQSLNILKIYDYDKEGRFVSVCCAGKVNSKQ